MYSKKSIGPRTEPYETRDVTYMMSDRPPLTDTHCLRFDRKDVMQLDVLPVILYEVSLKEAVCGAFVVFLPNLDCNLGRFVMEQLHQHNSVYCLVFIETIMPTL